jgi:hypothetical protein
VKYQEQFLPGETLHIWALAEDDDQDGYNEPEARQLRAPLRLGDVAGHHARPGADFTLEEAGETTHKFRG